MKTRLSCLNVSKYKQDILEYDAENNLTTLIVQNWNGSSWDKSIREIYYYQIISTTLKTGPLENSLLIFPNPSNGQFTVEFSKFDITNGEIHIYNSTGQLVHFQVIQNYNHKKSIDLNGLSEGTYFLQLIRGDKQSIQAFIIA